MFTSSTASHHQTTKSSEFRSQFQIAALRVLLKKDLQALKETPVDCENTFFNTTNFNRFYNHSFKHFSPQLNDPTVSQILITTMIFHLLTENLSLDTFHEQKKLMLRNSKVKSSMSSLKQNSITRLTMKFKKFITA